MASVRALREHTSDESPQIVHSHLAWADIVAAMARPPSAHLVSTEHGIAPGGVYHRQPSKRALRQLVHRARVRRVDSIIAVSRATAAMAERTWGRPRSGGFHVVPNGIDRSPRMLDAARPGTRFGCLARLAPEKDFATLLAAFKQVLKTMPEATLDIAGTGELEPWLRAEIDRRGLGPAVRLRGFMPPDQFFREVDVLVQLSLWENCSYSVLDAVVRGKGLVATEVGGYLEYLSGPCLVPVGDAASAADRMIQQAGDVTVRPSLPADWPSVREMTERIARVYATVTATRESRPPEPVALLVGSPKAG